jgi:hypothetical protein
MEPNGVTTTIDYVANITVPGEVFREPKNEYWALVCLYHGMESLYRLAVKCDEIVAKQIPPNVRFSGMGNHPFFAEVPKPMLTCAFHWYAISACQYVRTVGAIAYRQGASSVLPQEYANGIIPEVVTFRNKVAAHFAWSTENNRDNDAERLASIIPQLSFDLDSFRMGGLVISMRRGGNSNSSEAIAPWSLRKVHEMLAARYWPPQNNQFVAPLDPTE